MVRHVEAKNAPGIVTAIHRHGHTDVNAYGSLAFDGPPMQRDSIFRLASITKVMLAATTFSLFEDATLHLDAPVEKWLPELANRKVLKRIDGPLDDVVPAKRAITIRDLLTFKLGVGIFFGPPTTPFEKATVEKELYFGPPHPMKTPKPDVWMKRLGELPLQYQPGTHWMYSVGYDILGVLVARAAGKSLEDVMRERIFEPCGMKDTSFWCPPEKVSRFTTGYLGLREDKPLTLEDSPTTGEWNQPPNFALGASGLVSTADDCLAFGRMLLSHGVIGKTRVLSRPSLLAMATDQLGDAEPVFFPGFFDSRGWGLGACVVTKRTGLDASPGAFGWDGGWGTSLWVDPTEDMVAVLLTQRSCAPPMNPIYRDFWATTYGSLDI